MSNSTYQEIVVILDELRKRERIFVLARGILLWISVFLSITIPLFLLDNIVHFNTWLRWVSFFAIFLPSCFIILKELVLPLLHRHSKEWYARKIEKEYPHLNNAIINAILLGREGEKGFAAALLKESLGRMSSCNIKRIIKWEIVKKIAMFAVMLLLSLFIYCTFFPSYFSNAFIRIFAPGTSIAFISKTKVSVEPGEVRLLRGENLNIRAVLSGKIVQESIIKWKENGGSWKTARMPGEKPGIFNFTLSAPQKSLRYYVKAGDGVSPVFRAELIDPPAIETFEFACRYPAYTGIPAEKIRKKTGDIEILCGSNISIGGITNNPIGEARLRIAKKEYPVLVSNKNITGPQIAVKEDFGYSVFLKDIYGYTNAEGQSGSVKAIADRPPRIQVVLPGRHIIVGTFQSIPVLVNITDDYGIRTASIKYKMGEEKEKVLKSAVYPGTAHAATLQTWISPESMKLKSDDVLVYWVEAEDANNITGPGKSSSTFLTIRLVDPFVKLQESMRRLASSVALSQEQLKGIFSDLSAALKEILRIQKEIRKNTTDRATASALRALAIQEQDLRVRTIECQENFVLLARRAEGFSEVVQQCMKFANQMEELKIASLMAEAVKYLEDNVVYFAQGKEEEIIEKLNLILQSIQELNRNWLAKKFLEKESAARELMKNLDHFIEKQKDVIAVLERISKKPAEEYSPQDIKELQKQGEVEEGIRKELSKGTNDFKNAAEKDLGASVIVNTLEEIIAQVKRAEGEFKKVTITLDEKEMWKWIELAKELKQDLQMWLMNKPDTVQWNVANPLEDYDVPMPDIPAELQDMIGDLIQTEQEMDEAADNIMTGGWIDNMSTAGWAVADGPISNWSAKGKTGNMLPGNQELTGRSGEGRTGKSSGQFVEGKYRGLEGRKIPPRLSDERMQKGVVKEEKHRPTGGSTGGGKITGWGAEGLTDNIPPQVQEQLRRLALREAELKARAAEIKEGLNPYLVITSNLRQSITLMDDLERDLQEGRYQNLLEKRKLLSEKMSQLKTSVEDEVELRREPALRMDRNIRSRIVDALREKYPSRYEALIKEYFEVLSRELK